MWVIAVLLLVSFALFLFSRIAKTLRMCRVLGFFAIGVWFVVGLLTLKDFYAWTAIMGFLSISPAISDLIALPILRRRVIPPCVRVKRLQSGIYNIIISVIFLFFIAFVIFLLVTEGLESLRSSGMILVLGPATVAAIIYLILILFEKIEMCGNGVWLGGRLQPWEEYESFSWKLKMKDNVELKLVSNWGICRSTRLMVAPEDREAVQQLLEANIKQIYRI